MTKTMYCLTGWSLLEQPRQQLNEFFLVDVNVTAIWCEQSDDSLMAYANICTYRFSPRSIQYFLYVILVRSVPSKQKWKSAFAVPLFPLLFCALSLIESNIQHRASYSISATYNIGSSPHTCYDNPTLGRTQTQRYWLKPNTIEKQWPLVQNSCFFKLIVFRFHCIAAYLTFLQIRP